jgi:hypothetical protein
MLIGVPDARPRALAFLPESFHPWDFEPTTYVVGAYWHEQKKDVHVAAFGAMLFPGFPAGITYLDLIQLASLSDDDHGKLELQGARKLGMAKPWGKNPTFDEWIDRSFYDEAELEAMLTNYQHRPAGSDAWYMYRRPRED